MAITISIDYAKELAAKIDAIDEKVDAASGSENAGRRAIINTFVAEAGTRVDTAASAVLSILDNENIPKENKVGVFFGVIDMLEKKYGTDFNEFVKGLVEANKSRVVPISEEEVKTLTETRKKLTEGYRAIKQLLESTGEDVSSLPVLKKRTGSRGKRGPRALSGTTYQFAINGTDLSAADNTLLNVAKRVTVTVKAEDGTESEVTWKAIDLRKYMATKIEKFDVKNPPDSWSIMLPNGETFAAKKLAPSADEEDDEEDDDETTED